jgi:hypothetical protein
MRDDPDAASSGESARESAQESAPGLCPCAVLLWFIGTRDKPGRSAYLLGARSFTGWRSFQIDDDDMDEASFEGRQGEVPS